MLSFNCTIRDPLGIHARPAGLLAREAKAHPAATITIRKGEQAVKATQLIHLMGMGVKQGDSITITAEGPGEAAAIEAMRRVFMNM